ncbi:Enoyl-CoA hydratase PaaG [Hydrogenophaga intermedia]|uniref:Enoyl-CoA hydratase PaaG n=1 Tax=Hydrogenophaga intermedia TaxID=65786 RepID=A0A1L1PBH0_HYDIT|nr:MULTISPECIES: enoyl-CoA hydratase-related protein [Hydrogenophaga]AOS78009.1 hypothetical protein Q5W_02930 [Hydrogenophaga sp. PBC]CDN86144.1 Enoyl-CoA hydratase PaaG [Hydrogenophaga intermedia]
MTDELVVTQEGFVANVSLNRPERKNAWNASMEIGLRQIMTRLASDPGVRVIILTGKGSVFCAGVDVGALGEMTRGGDDISLPPAQVAESMGAGDFEQRYSYLLSIPKPIICVLNGAAAGVGLVLSLYCDIRYAASSAKLAAPFGRRGLVAEHGIAWILPRLIGMSRAMEWLMSARTLPASEAHAMGLVSEVFEPEELSAKAHARATEIAQTVSPRSIRVMKRQLWEGATLSLAQACRMAEKEVKSAVASQDFKEGVQHFMEKRPPRFTGQ